MAPSRPTPAGKALTPEDQARNRADLTAREAVIRDQERRIDGRSGAWLALTGGLLTAAVGGLISGKAGPSSPYLAGVVAALAAAGVTLGAVGWPRLAGFMNLATVRPAIDPAAALAAEQEALERLTRNVHRKYRLLQVALVLLAVAVGAAVAAAVVRL